MRSRVLTGWLFVAGAAAGQKSPLPAVVDEGLAPPTTVAPVTWALLKARVE